MAEPTILVRVVVCPLDHGGLSNEALVYGHPHRSDACIRIWGTDTWVHSPERPE